MNEIVLSPPSPAGTSLSQGTAQNAGSLSSLQGVKMDVSQRMTTSHMHNTARGLPHWFAPSIGTLFAV